MAIIKCKMCGGDIELAADKTFGTCEFCGCTMTFPKVDDDQRAAAFNRGNHFRRIGEFDKALSVYERIVQEDDTDAEAHWCCALCRFGIEYVEDPATYEWLPTCHRASFDSFLEDVDYKAAVEHSDGITRRQYQKEAAKIAEVQKGILATSQNEEPYDVFICYKESDENGDRTKDSTLAQDIYYQLTEQGRRVFFARITLEDIVGKQYEPYIFAALHSAKVMIVVGTKPEYLNAVWVKNEWSRFLAMMKKDRSKLLLPCYRDMDPYDLPEQLSVLQSYDMGKIGFIQDLTRGIAKVLDAEKKTESVKETVVVQQSGGVNVAALLKRGTMVLEDKEWEKADGFFEEVLNQDPENAEAYLGKTCAQLHLSRPDMIASDTSLRVLSSTSFNKVMRFGSAEMKATLNDFVQKAREKKRAEEKMQQFGRAKAAMEKAKSVSAYLEAASFFDALGEELNAKEYAAKCRTLADELDQKLKAEKAEKERLEREAREKEEQRAEQRRADQYKAACEKQAAESSIEEMKAAETLFLELETYRDAAARAEQCKVTIERLEEEKRAAEEAEEKKRTARTIRTIIFIGAGVLAAVILSLITTSANAKREQDLFTGKLMEVLSGYTEHRVFEVNWSEDEYEYKGEMIVPDSISSDFHFHEDGKTVTWTRTFDLDTGTDFESSDAVSSDHTYTLKYMDAFDDTPVILLDNGIELSIWYKNSAESNGYSTDPADPLEIDHMMWR